MPALDTLLRFVSGAPTPQAFFDRAGRYLAWSERWAQDHGVAGDQAGTSRDEAGPEPSADLDAVCRRALAGVGHAHLTSAGAAGQALRYHARPWHTTDGAVGGVAVDADDPAGEGDRRQRGALVMAAREVEATIWAFDADRRMTLHVGAPLETLGVGQGWNVGEDTAVVYADLPEIIDAVGQALAGQPSACTVHFDGRTFETVVNPMVDDIGAVCGGVGISLDVTDREQARVGLSQRQRLLDSALSSAPVVMYTFDAGGTIRLSRGQGLEVLGLAEGDAVGASVWDWTEPGSEAARQTPRVLTGHTARWTAEIAGETFETSASPTEDGGGVAVSTRVTARVEAERRAERHAARLRRLLQAVAQEGTFGERAQAVLREVTDSLGLDAGLLARVDGGRYTCRASYAAHGTTMAPGESIPLADAYCAVTVAEGDVVAIEHMAESAHRERPCYALHGLEA